MLGRLKRVDPRRGASPISRASAAFANTRLGRFFSIQVLWRVDPWLMRVTRGRVGLGLGVPTALLETTGARSGERRANAVIYFHDGDRVTIVASKLGLPEHPAWFHNLRAHPDTRIQVGRHVLPVRAHVASDEERERLWPRCVATYGGFADYQARAGRTIPLVVLSPRA
jgi:deazaflavin-dependent oxidoreductase (nitroreductase family)